MERSTTCRYCGQPMNRWANPTDSTWTGDVQFVCFNDECPYYVRGWNWMRERFAVNASYRYRLDPSTGETGPLPVWSPSALRGNILTDAEDCHAG